MKLKCFKMEPDAYAPLQATEGAAGFDLSAYTMSHGRPLNVAIFPGDKVTFHTKLKFEIEPGYMMIIASRSGLGAGKGCIVINQPGIIDSDYRGEVMITLFNSVGDNDDLAGDVIKIHHGMRIAQAIIVPVPVVELEMVARESDLSTTARGGKGHGSTGV